MPISPCCRSNSWTRCSKLLDTPLSRSRRRGTAALGRGRGAVRGAVAQRAVAPPIPGLERRPADDAVQLLAGHDGNIIPPRPTPCLERRPTDDAVQLLAGHGGNIIAPRPTPCPQIVFPQPQCYRVIYSSLERKCYWGNDGGRGVDDDCRTPAVPAPDAAALPRAIPAEKTRLLDEMVAMTTLHCKSLVRLLDPGRLDRQPRRRQRGRA